jgi:hypothetical protein
MLAFSAKLASRREFERMGKRQFQGIWMAETQPVAQFTTWFLCHILAVAEMAGNR